MGFFDEILAWIAPERTIAKVKTPLGSVHVTENSEHRRLHISGADGESLVEAVVDTDVDLPPLPKLPKVPHRKVLVTSRGLRLRP